RVALRQHERRRGQRILQRRHFRGDPQPAEQTAAAEGGLAHVRVQLQGPAGQHSRRRAGTRRRHRAGGQRASRRRTRADHRAVDRRRVRFAPVVGNLRSRDEGRVRDPGRHRPQHRQGLQVTLTPRERRAMQFVATSDPEAYDYYLRGRSYMYSMARRDYEHAIRMFEQAIAVDSKYALAYAGMADAFSMLYRYAEASAENAARANRASEQALALDADSAEAHASRG